MTMKKDAARKSRKKLTLKKETLKDLVARVRNADALKIRGGVYRRGDSDAPYTTC